MNCPDCESRRQHIIPRGGLSKCHEDEMMEYCEQLAKTARISAGEKEAGK
jgi:hypothetical protein